MGKSLMSLHRKLEAEKFQKKIMDKVQRTMVPQTEAGMKAIFLLALKKEGWGKKRALRLWDEVDRLETAILDGEITWDDVISQVREEYQIDIDYKNTGVSKVC